MSGWERILENLNRPRSPRRPPRGQALLDRLPEADRTALQPSFDRWRHNNATNRAFMWELDKLMRASGRYKDVLEIARKSQRD